MNKPVITLTMPSGEIVVLNEVPARIEFDTDDGKMFQGGPLAIDFKSTLWIDTSKQTAITISVDDNVKIGLALTNYDPTNKGSGAFFNHHTGQIEVIP